MHPSHPPAWADFVGRDLFTADNHWIGIVKSVGPHPRDGSAVLVVDSNRTDSPPICVRYHEIGVVTPSRVMLDVVLDIFERDRESRFRCLPEFLNS